MEMDLFQGRAVDLRLGNGNKFENGYGGINHRLRESALADDAADLPQSPMVPLLVMFGVAVVTISVVIVIIMAVPVIMPVIMPVVMPMIMPVVMPMIMPVVMSVVVIFRRIHVPSGMRVENVKFGSHQPVFAHLARPYAKSFQAEGVDVITDDFDIGAGVDQGTHEHVAADAGRCVEIENPLHLICSFRLTPAASLLIMSAR
jgi:hypothetical protein